MVNNEIQKLINKRPRDFTEEDWQGRDDASTLVRARKIRSDDSRLNNARLWAGVMAAQKGEEDAALEELVKELDSENNPS